MAPTQVDIVTKSFSDSKQYIVGSMVELHLPLRFSIEADALYRPLNLDITNLVVPQTTPSHYAHNHATWEFPILAKYRLPFPLPRPYVEAGPSFRAKGSSLNWLSTSGFTLGGGVELKVSRLRISPEIRYTRWGDDSKPGPGVGFLPPSQMNQAELLVGLSF